MEFREDRRKIGATWEKQVLEGCRVRGSDDVVDAKRCK